ncbi:sugar phosphate isomerase/epimerase family protein [Paenibacillus piri]|uniref:Sugar phosphate isomerase/epimerase n=1 Tax=Paenibacillus piri TaxID=2547395 RepID=A0A4R5KFR3_9BACL|nr:TIM barrel protein [Paenibacillus piri]TDF93030.1 sugar phosphate isomerase/epimerase [Paenibacillus piri]
MNVSIGGFSFYQLLSSGEMDIYGYLETARHRFGLKSVDLWNGFFTDRSNPYYPVADDGDLRKIKRSLDEKQLTVANFAIDRAHLWDPDPGIREILHKNALDYLRAAELLGARTVRIDTSRGPVEPSEEQFEYTVMRYKEYAQRAADFGYTIGPENHTGISLDPHWMKRLAEAVDHPGYGVLLHIGRWQDAEEPGEPLLAPWVNHVHLDAARLSSETTADIMRMLMDQGYQGDWAVEYNAQSHPYIELEWALASAKRLLAKAGAAGPEQGNGGQ